MSGREHLPIEDDPTSLEEAEAEGRVPIGEEPTAVQRFGTTAAEQRRGDTLAHRLLEEEPDVAGENGRTSELPASDRQTAKDEDSRTMLMMMLLKTIK